MFTAVEALLFLWCLRWPVTDFKSERLTYLTLPETYKVTQIEFQRPPLLEESYLRTTTGSAIVIVAWAMIVIANRLLKYLT